MQSQHEDVVHQLYSRAPCTKQMATVVLNYYGIYDVVSRLGWYFQA